MFTRAVSHYLCACNNFVFGPTSLPRSHHSFFPPSFLCRLWYICTLDRCHLNFTFVNMITLTHPPPIIVYRPSCRYFVRRLRSINPTSPDSTIESGRPRPLYTMSSHRTILSPATYAQLASENLHHPRIRTHRAACEAMELFHLGFSPRPEHKLTYNAVPPNLRVLCNHYNERFLTLDSDRKLSAIQLWRVIFRCSFSHRHLDPPRITSHQAIFI